MKIPLVVSSNLKLTVIHLLDHWPKANLVIEVFIPEIESTDKAHLFLTLHAVTWEVAYSESIMRLFINISPLRVWALLWIL